MAVRTSTIQRHSWLFIVLVAIGTSCAVSSKVAQNTSYRDAAFTVSRLESEGLALLPIVAGMGVEGYRRPFGDAMNHLADSLFQKFSKWDATMQSLNDKGLVAEYNTAIQAYQETGILDRNVLTRMKEATGMEFFFFVRLMPPASKTNVSVDAFGNVSRETSQSVSAVGLIWSATKGDVVWEGAATAEVITGSYAYTDETDQMRAEKVARALVLGLYK